MRKALAISLAVAAAAALTVAATAAGGGSSAAASGAVPGCAVSSLNLLEEGKLTIGADNPAFPPWFGGAEKDPWKVSNPFSRKGYESAVAYAIARELGFRNSAVDWTYVPFSKSFRPGKKPFDFYITQVSITKERAKVVNFSKPYYFVNQAIVGRKGTPIAKAKSINDLKPYRLGAQLGTTSYAFITNNIKPSQTPRAFDTNDLAVQALKNGQIDGIVVDLPTSFYVTAVQVEDGKIVGQFANKGGKEGFGLVFEKGNKLRTCVNKAIDRLWKKGTIAKLQQAWLSRVAGAPVVK
jgi:polar amino acid transport system substrate-binding protein